MIASTWKSTHEGELSPHHIRRCPVLWTADARHLSQVAPEQMDLREASQRRVSQKTSVRDVFLLSVTSAVESAYLYYMSGRKVNKHRHDLSKGTRVRRPHL